MQAPLSSTASGRLFRSGPSLSPLSITSRSTLDRQENQLRNQTGGSKFPQGPSSGSVAEGRGLAHDAGNLLSALGLYSELLARPGVLREEHRHYAEELQMLSRRSRDLMDRLLNPATPVGTGARVSKSRSKGVSIPEVIEDCRGILNAVARRVLTVTYGAGAALPVEVSRESLERILINLTKNAAEAIREAGECAEEATITLRVSCQGEGSTPRRIILAVEDKGNGMSAAAIKALLEGQNERGLGSPRSGNHGIGFRVVRELVRNSEGKLQMMSRLGSGTTVSIAWEVAGETKDRTRPETERDLEGNPLEERRLLMAIARNGRTAEVTC